MKTKKMTRAEREIALRAGVDPKAYAAAKKAGKLLSQVETRSAPPTKAETPLSIEALIATTKRALKKSKRSEDDLADDAEDETLDSDDDNAGDDGDDDQDAEDEGDLDSDDGGSDDGEDAEDERKAKRRAKATLRSWIERELAKGRSLTDVKLAAARSGYSASDVMAEYRVISALRIAKRQAQDRASAPPKRKVA
jgi:hypothetical protein